MYTNLPTYRIVIALLKKFNIRHLVLSAGSRNVPFVHSVEEDPYFKCYSVVDERSAAYFAMGLAQELQEPVLISCTASTASSNYWPAIGEAFYQGVPIVILTSDRNPSRLHQWEDQMIDQVGMFDRHVRKSVNLPIINDDDDWVFCERLVNEALLELNHNGTGPVHINVPMKDYCMAFDESTLPDVRKISRFKLSIDKEKCKEMANKLAKAKRILVTCGQQTYISEELNNALSTFFKKYNAVIAVEHMSNIQCEGAIHTAVCAETRYLPCKLFSDYIPDIVISYGYNIFNGIKPQLLSHYGKYEHWSIQPDGSVVDMYNSLTTIFECDAQEFFAFMNEYSNGKNDLQYYSLFKELHDSVKYPEFKYSSVYAIKNVVENIPSGSILHMAINNSIRIPNFFKIAPGIKSYANIGTYGIDGCLSSLVGQAAATDNLCYLITGDLAFFYDMNALRIKHIGNNIRVLMVNNEGGGEFYYNGSWVNKSSDLHTTARHATKAEGWVKENNFIYLSAHDEASFKEAMKTFMSTDSDKSIFLEVFTEMKDDSDVIHDFYKMSEHKDTVQEMKNIVRKFIPRSVIANLKKLK